MSEIVLKICGDASCLQKEFQQAASSGDKFAKETDKKVTGKLSGSFNKLGNTIKNNLLPVFAIGGLIAGAASAIREATEIINKFDSAVAELSAITGATGEDLDFFRQKAIQLGPEFAKSATEVVDAFKLVGSARPELLKNSEALAEVTESALLLAQASGLELETSVDSLTSTLNQFGVPAEKAADAVNTLAAGSKAGAAPVDQISQSLVAFGAVANQSNVSLEESVGLIETLADKSITGSEAGNKLRNVLTILSTADALPKTALDELEKFGVNLDVVTDNSIPLNERLTEFSKIAGDSTALVKVFGRENQVAGSIILNNVDRFNELTDAVTGTNVAFEQAEIVSRTLEFQTAKTEATYESLVLSLDNGTGPLSETLVGYEKLKQSLFEFLTTANDATASNDDLVNSLNKFTAAFDSFAGTGLISEAQKQLAGVNATLDKYVDANVNAAFAAQDLARETNLGQEAIQEGVKETGVVLDTQVTKLGEIAEQVRTTSGAEKERALENFRLQQRIVDGIEEELKARRNQALTAGVGPTAGTLGDIQAFAERKKEEERLQQEQDKKDQERDKNRDKRRKEREKLEAEVAKLRANALEDERERELALLELSFQKELKAVEKSEEGKRLAREQFEREQLEINQKFDELGIEQNAQAIQLEAEQAIRSAEELNVRLEEIELNRLEQRKILLQNAGQDTTEVDSQILAQRQALNDAQLDLDVSRINERADLERLSATQTITNAEELADAELQIEIEKLEAIIAARQAAGESSIEQEQELANLRLGIRQEEIASEQELQSTRKDAAIELAGTLRDLAIASLQAQTDAQVEAINEQKDAELAAIDEQLAAETLSEQQREQLLKERERIEQEADNRAKELQREQAERERAIATFEAFINGAVAFTKALTIDPTGILAGITAAQTIAQIALINSQPLPAFAKGTENSPEGYALVGEQGPEIVYLPKGSKVKTATETRRIMNSGISGHAINNIVEEQRSREVYLSQKTSNNYQNFQDGNLIRSGRDTQKAIYETAGMIVDELKRMNYKGRGVI